ncbi:MAG: hypothetical protein JSS71_06745 [Armatimonadetes bacterium]|nr:hypothetical protein [Armatimonadota bacterium]MBX3107670.1 hypothetical protein [Fimbriimonadaceae bacterium]
MSFHLIVNHSQRRLAADRLTAVAGGLEFNGSVWQGTWIDPVTRTLMLRPKTLETEWYTQDTGDFAKWGLADFAASPQWEERQGQHWAGPWLAVKDAASNPSAVTVASHPKNMGLSFSWFSYGAGDTFLQYKVGWNDTADDGSGVALHFWSDGRVDVFRDGALVESGKVSGAKSREVRRLQVFEVMALPIRHRELLVLGQSGDGFATVFSDISPEDPDPVITPAGKVWFQCQSGATQAQIAPLRFAGEGFATSLKTSFLEAPQAGEILVDFVNGDWLVSPAPYRVYGFPGYSAGVQSVIADLVEWDGTTAFAPGDGRNEIRLRANLATTDNRFSPFVMGVQVAYPPIGGDTDGSAQIQAESSVREAVLSIPDRPSGVALDLVIPQLDDLESSTAGSVTRGGVPVALHIDDSLVMDGFAEPASVSVGRNGATSATWVIRDRWAVLEDTVFADRIPLDGLPFRQALALLIEKSGIDPARVMISETGPVLPYATGEFSGEWGILIEAGDRASDWVTKLMDTFAPGWWYGFRPAADGSGEEFFALPEDELGGEPVAALNSSATAGPAYRNLQRESIEPMANEVRVTGQDPRTLRPMQSVRTDYSAQTVATPPGSRPPNWGGTVKRFALVDAGLTTQAAVDDTCNGLFAQLSKRQELVQFESGFLQRDNGVPVWRGDVVNLEGVGDVRIRSFGVRFRHETPGMTYRSALYTGVLS